ncbi:MAG: hypothetical protein QXI19_13985 [Candidatus Caldarchaeum sp.]
MSADDMVGEESEVLRRAGSLWSVFIWGRFTFLSEGFRYNIDREY